MSLRGRGTDQTPPNRFAHTAYVRDVDLAHDPQLDTAADGEGPRHLPLTQFLADASKTILAHNDSPDVPFTWSVNPYRGCEHGCAYCFARPTHEYLGFSAGLDFETKIMVKHDAPALLRAALANPKWQPDTIAISGVTDCYQPAERQYRLTRGCLEVLRDFRNPVVLVTKNHLITRDRDVLAELAGFSAAMVFVSITTLDQDLTRVLEPRTSVPRDRLRTIRELSAAGVPCGVMVAPVIPGLTDHELMPILAAARAAGAVTAGFVPLRLPFAVKDIFAQWLADHFPDRKDKVLHRVLSVRAGRMNDPNFHSRMCGAGPFAEQIHAMFQVGKHKAGYPETEPKLSSEHFRRVRTDGQGNLFD